MVSDFSLKQLLIVAKFTLVTQTAASVAGYVTGLLMSLVLVH